MIKKIINKAASVRAKLMNIAKNEKIDFDYLLLKYFQERFLYRLSISKYSEHYNFHENKLKKAIESTFKKRKTILPDNPLIFQNKFQNDKERQKQWSAFLHKSKIFDTDENFNQIMKRITEFLKPVVASIKNKSQIEKLWYSS